MAHQEPKVSVWTGGLTKFKYLMNVETIMPRILVINRRVISNEKKNYIYSKSFLMEPTYIAQKRTFVTFAFMAIDLFCKEQRPCRYPSHPNPLGILHC